MNTFLEISGVVDWSRAQFALTAIYHWLFVPLTLGLGVLCAIFETAYVRTRNEAWRRTARFWMRIFGINFAAGVATGLILEFEFGTAWSNYSHFVGDIFGAPLAIEGIAAFFLEATFLAVMFFGWDRVSKRFHLTATWLTAIGANLSALWILVANAWMQNPVGTAFNPQTARNEMTSFLEVLFSPTAMAKFTHTVTSGFVLGALVVLGISAWYLLRGREKDLAFRSIKVAAIFGFAASLAVLWTGHWSGGNVAKTQPMKLAAMEGLYQGRTHAGLSVVGVLKPGTDAFYFNWQLPGMLSWMAYGQTDAFVPGIRDLVEGNAEHGIEPASVRMGRGRESIAALARYQRALRAGEAVPATIDTTDFGYGYLRSAEELIPPVALVFYSFRVMVGLGALFILLFFICLWRKAVEKRWLQHCLLWSIPLAYAASISGWIVAEVGRQPWAIQGLMPVGVAVSRISAASVQVTFWLFAALFTAMLVAELSILIKQIKIGGR